MNQEQKLQAFAEREFAALVDKIIIPTDNGGFTAFGRYHGRPCNTGFQVDIDGQHSQWFGSRRSAVSWCVADHNRQYRLAETIHMLDAKKTMLQTDIAARHRIADKSKVQNFYDIVDTKIQRKQAYLEAVSTELEKCLYSAKYMQIRGFSNETARTVRTFTNRANRAGV